VIFLSKGAAKQPIISAKRVWRTTLKNSLLGLSEQMQPPAPVSGHCHHKEPGALFWKPRLSILLLPAAIADTNWSGELLWVRRGTPFQVVSAIETSDSCTDGSPQGGGTSRAIFDVANLYVTVLQQYKKLLF